MTAPFSAVASAVGYYYQALYALILLLEGDDDLVVSVETADDVFAESNSAFSLHQLKCVDPTSTLTLKSVGLWKTLRVWSVFVNSESSRNCLFFLVTTAGIDTSGSLNALLDKSSDRTHLLSELITEAERVIRERQQAAAKGKKGADLPHKERYKGCQEFLDLDQETRKWMVNRIQIQTNAFKPEEIDSEVSKRLQVKKDLREKIAYRLVEWWDTQIFRSLSNKRSREVRRDELLEKLVGLIRDSDENALFDDYSKKKPPDLGAEQTDIMVRQIQLVQGTPAQIARAAREKWRARNQRRRWMEDDIGIASEIDEYDDHLIEEWSDRHEHIRELTENADDNEKCSRGYDLLQWSHEKAPLEIRPIRPTWDKPFLVRGTYQMMAELKNVGWHPDYVKLLKETEETDGDGDEC